VNDEKRRKKPGEREWKKVKKVAFLSKKEKGCAV
jgi:hypothetical protein